MKPTGLRLAAAAVAVLVLCGLYAVAAPGRGREYFVDQVIYRETLDAMRDGRGYYAAMDSALRANNGPASSTRAFRTPTVFLLWRLLPGAKAVWIAFCLVVAVSALALLLAFPDGWWASPLVALYLLHFARPHFAQGWGDLHLLVELWALPGLALVALAARRREWGWAAGASFLAVAVRELTAPVLVGGLAVALLRRRARASWGVAVGAAMTGWVVHDRLVHRYLSDHGDEIALLGTGGPRRVLTMASVGLPGSDWVGVLLLGVGLTWLWRQGDVRWVLGPMLLLPLTGFFVGRDYWGVLVVPFAITLAAAAVNDVLVGRASSDA